MRPVQFSNVYTLQMNQSDSTYSAVRKAAKLLNNVGINTQAHYVQGEPYLFTDGAFYKSAEQLKDFFTHRPPFPKYPREQRDIAQYQEREARDIRDYIPEFNQAEPLTIDYTITDDDVEINNPFQLIQHVLNTQT